jgi:biopolymer transport protein ExbB
MIMRLLLSLILFYCLVPSSAFAWWNKDWDYRKEFVIDTSATGLPINNTVNEVTVLIRLHLGNFTYFADTLPGGEDIRFMSGDDITPLKHHIELYDPIQQIGLIWVKVPRLIPGTNLEKIYMYYGNQSAVKGDDAAASYGVDDVLVYHFDGTPADKTAYNNHPQSNSAEEIATAVIGQGVQFNGESSIVIPSSPSLRLLPDPGNTVSLWISFSQEQSDATLFAYIADDGASLSLKINGAIPYLQYINTKQQSFRTDLEGVENLPLESWSQLAFTVNQEQLALYVNGNQYAVLDTVVEEMGGVLSLGAWTDGTQGFIGQVDELHLLKTAASADRILMYANNQGVASTLIRAGADGQQEGAGEGHNYIAFSLSKLTLEGKITTGILAVMLIFSFVIMFGKGFFLGAVRKANNLFERRYTGEESTQEKSDSVKGFDTSSVSLVSLFESVNTQDKKLKESPLNRLFKTGMRELNGRLAASTAGAQRVQSLSPNSVSAIRASMDTVVVRENQRLQKQMVLLTIAISGGPFIGLFGTVMGVMITFAEVALAGNVDVNAIAPGISAALVATVAGLAVAIPCLFGYNYLASQIKEISADMRVFVDEFEARLAEEFGE